MDKAEWVNVDIALPKETDDYLVYADHNENTSGEDGTVFQCEFCPAYGWEQVFENQAVSHWRKMLNPPGEETVTHKQEEWVSLSVACPTVGKDVICVFNDTYYSKGTRYAVLMLNEYGKWDSATCTQTFPYLCVTKWKDIEE